MFDPKLYREACRELTAPEDKIKEIIAMTEKTNKRRIRPLRTALICAAAMAMMVVSVAAANPEAVEEFFYNIVSIVRVDDYRQELTTADGEKVTLFSVPEAAVELRDGRAILTLDGEDEADITEVLANTGRYEYQKDCEGSRVIVTVEGTTQDWKIAVSVGDPGSDNPTVTYSSDDVDDGVDGHFIVKDDGVGGEDCDTTVGIYTTGADVPAQH